MSQGLTQVTFHGHTGTNHTDKDDTWTYEHADNSRRITKSVAPDGTTTDTAYDDVVDRISSVSVYSAASGERDLLSQETYSYEVSPGNYDAKNRLCRYEKNNLRVDYVYNDTANTVTVTQRSKETPSTVFGETVYTYGTDTTTVTRKHATTSSLDQATVYTYFTKTKTYGQSQVVSKTWLRSVTDPEDNTTTYSAYVGLDTDTAGLTVDEDYKFTENPNMYGKVFKVNDARGNDTVSTYDTTGTGNLLSVTHPGDYTEAYSYYGTTSWPKVVKNVRGNYTLYVRNTSDLSQVTAIKVSEPISGNPPNDTQWASIAAIKTFAYHDDGNHVGMLETETVPGIDTDTGVTKTDYTKTYSYVDANGKVQPGPTQVSYPYASGPNVTTYSADQSSATVYDSMGRVQSTTDADNRVISYTYDKLGRTLKTFYGSTSKFTENHYLSCCGLEYTTDEDGRETHYEYDHAGRVTKTWTNIDVNQGSDFPLVAYTYDSFGNVYEVRTRKDDTSAERTTAYTYDKNNRVVEIDHPTGLGSEYFAYDGVGNLIAKRDGANAITAYEYDGLGRLVAVKYNYGSMTPSYPLSSPDVSYTYVGGSRLRESMVEASRGTTQYGYDMMDRLNLYIPCHPNAHQVTYQYNKLGQKTRMFYQGVGGGTLLDVRYGYYANGWLKRVKNGTTPVSAYTYDEVGNRTRADLGNSDYTTYEYDADPRYRVDGITHNVTGTPSTYAVSYLERDSAGNPKSIEDWNGTTAYTYDNNSRLVQTGGYDWVGNRNPASWSYNAADQLTAISGQHQYTYLGTGSLEYQKDSSGTNIQKAYTYTAANLLESITHDDVSGDPTSSMTWDADGNRVSFTSSEGTGEWQYMYDTTAGIPAVIGEVWPDDFWAGYIREPNGALIASMMYPSSPIYHYYHFDALGSTRLITDSAGAVTDTYSYDAWGNTTHDTGSLVQPYQYVGELGYYTHYQDASLPLLQLGVRFYVPEIGRFTQVDPLREGSNWYAYCGCTPLSRVDPTGLSIRESYCSLKYKACMTTRKAWADAVLKNCLLGCKWSRNPPNIPTLACTYGNEGDDTHPPVEENPFSDWSDALRDALIEQRDGKNADRIYRKCVKDCRDAHDARGAKAHKDCGSAYDKCMAGGGMPF